VPECRACGFNRDGGKEPCPACGAAAWHPRAQDASDVIARRLAIGASVGALVLLSSSPLIDVLWPRSALSTSEQDRLHRLGSIGSVLLGSIPGADQLGVFAFVGVILLLFAGVFALVWAILPLLVAWRSWRHPRAMYLVCALCGLAGILGAGGLALATLSQLRSSSSTVIVTLSGSGGAVGSAYWLFRLAEAGVVLVLSLVLIWAAVRQHVRLTLTSQNDPPDSARDGGPGRSSVRDRGSVST